MAVYGAVPADGRQLFGLHDRFDGPTFLEYARELHAKFGKAAMLCYRISPHRTTGFREYVGRMNGNVVVICLQMGIAVSEPR